MSFFEEIGRAGSEQAASAFSTLLKLPVTVRTLRTFLLSIPQVSAFSKEPEEVFVGIYFILYGKEMGSVLVTMPREHACRIAEVMCRRPVGSTKILDEFSQSAVREVGNILVGAYLGAVRTRVPVPLIQSIPYVAMDRWEAIIDAVLPSLLEAAESVLLIETELGAETIDARCWLILVVGNWGV